MEVDLHSNVRAENAMDSQTISGAGTTDGNVIDTRGYESLEFIVHAHTVTAAGTSNVPQIEESDVVTFGGEETVVDSDHTLGSFNIDDNADDDKVFRVGSIGKKRYQRLSIVSVGSANWVGSAVAVLGHPKNAAVAEQAT